MSFTSKTKTAAVFLLPQPFFCKATNLFAHRSGAKKRSIPVGLLTYVSSDDLSAFSEILPMTDFRQRQAISTLTVPAVRGLAPHYLVQPVSPYEQPGHGNKYEIIYRLHNNTKQVKVNIGFRR